MLFSNTLVLQMTSGLCAVFQHQSQCFIDCLDVVQVSNDASDFRDRFGLNILYISALQDDSQQEKQLEELGFIFLLPILSFVNYFLDFFGFFLVNQAEKAEGNPAAFPFPV